MKVKDFNKASKLFKEYNYLASTRSRVIKTQRTGITLSVVGDPLNGEISEWGQVKIGDIPISKRGIIELMSVRLAELMNELLLLGVEIEDAKD